MIASRERRPDSSPAVMMFGGAWACVGCGVGVCVARLFYLRGLYCLGRGWEGGC